MNGLTIVYRLLYENMSIQPIKLVYLGLQGWLQPLLPEQGAEECLKWQNTSSRHSNFLTDDKKVLLQ